MIDKDIHVYYHVCLKNNGLSIAIEQLHLLAISTLLYRAKTVNIGIKYTDDESTKSELINIINQYNLLGNIKILYLESNDDNDNQELSTAIHFKNYADSLPEDVNSYILYFHTKGIGHHRKQTENAARFWRNYMEYFLIQHWKICVSRLMDGYESCGTYCSNINRMHEYLNIDNNVELNKNKFYYPGSFYWMNTSLIKRIPKRYFYNDTEYKRWSIEVMPALIEHNHFAFSSPNPPDANLYEIVLHPLQYIV